MTEIVLSCKVKYPTKKINDESVQPLLDEFKKKLKEFMVDNSPKDKKVIVSRTKKKDVMKRFLPDEWVQKQCPICNRKFKTAHKQEYCGRCRLEMERTGESAVELRKRLMKDGSVREPPTLIQTIPRIQLRDTEEEIEHFLDETYYEDERDR